MEERRRPCPALDWTKRRRPPRARRARGLLIWSRAQARRHPGSRGRRGHSPPQSRHSFGSPSGNRRSALRRARAGRRQVRARALSRRAMESLGGRSELHLPPRPERPIPRRRADHLRRRRLLARSRQGTPPVRERHVRCGGRGPDPGSAHRRHAALKAPPRAHAGARAAPHASPFRSTSSATAAIRRPIP